MGVPVKHHRYFPGILKHASVLFAFRFLILCASSVDMGSITSLVLSKFRVGIPNMILHHFTPNNADLQWTESKLIAVYSDVIVAYDVMTTSASRKTRGSGIPRTSQLACKI